MIELAAEVGIEDVTVRGLSRLAGVSTGTFYRHFSNVEECFAATVGPLTQCALRRAYTAQRDAGGGEDGVRAALRVLLTDIERHPKEARVLLVETFAGSEDLRPLMNRGTVTLERILSGAFAPTSPEAVAPRHVARGLAAGFTRVARSRVLAGRTSELPGLVGELGDWVIALSAPDVVGMDLPERSVVYGQESAGRKAASGELASFLGPASNERAQILTAVLRLGLLEGMGELTVSRVRAQAGVSRRAFHSHYSNLEECFFEAVETVARSAAIRAQQAARQADGGVDVVQLVETICAEVARHPALATLVFTEVGAAGKDGLCRVDQLLSLAAGHFQALHSSAADMSGITHEVSIAAAWRIAQGQAGTTHGHRLQQLSPLVARISTVPRLEQRHLRESVPI
jgi:AcrR family transcriptional regulator